MSEENEETRHPRASKPFAAHAAAESVLLESYKSGRIPHAWLIGGPPGIGKATLAYRMARFVLAHPDPSAPEVQQAKTLTLPDDHPVVRRVVGQAHPDLLAIERVTNEKTGKLFSEIRVEDIRRTVGFFGATAGEGGWRVAIVDSIDELNAAGENALLKVLEEPPLRALLILVSHAPGRVLATIRSRCRQLLMRPLDAADVARAVAAVTGKSADDDDVAAAAGASEGSVARALGLLDGTTLALRQRVIDLLAQLPNPDPRALHALGDALGGSEPETLAAFIDLVNGWLSARLESGTQEPPQSIRLAQAWDKINSAARLAEAYNLERKPLVFTVFGALAEAAR